MHDRHIYSSIYIPHVFFQFPFQIIRIVRVHKRRRTRFPDRLSRGCVRDRCLQIRQINNIIHHTPPEIITRNFFIKP
uniref:Uncharacterized protein n=1 Tax=uncultured marine virus TaxID=186617 RepID=A0A0F7L0V3_9VIRU|nr:hypothetical protein [uncultured marine virus]